MWTVRGVRMVKLLIIADDFTGAMDTGVQFAANGTVTQVVAQSSYPLDQTDPATEVLVLDTETRHLSPDDAYAIVYRIVKQASELKIPYIYKKTDSALRGNIGSELAAVVNAARCFRLPFIPAFPKMGRTTQGGIHYINGTPVSESIFGRDPFEPVKYSQIPDIIAQQTTLPALLYPKGASPAYPPFSVPHILVFDGESDADLTSIGYSLTPDGLHISAGCAGFATVLNRLLLPNQRNSPSPPLIPRLFVVCGSMNPVTTLQLDLAERAGIPRFCLTAEQKLSPAWLHSGSCAQLVRRCLSAIAHNQVCILDSNSQSRDGGSLHSAETRQLSSKQIRTQITAVLGNLAKTCLDAGLDAALMCIGGDTLVAFMQTIGVNTLTPICELSPGVVLATFVYRGIRHQIISKSGGFGEPDLLCKLVRHLKINLPESEGTPYAYSIPPEDAICHI